MDAAETPQNPPLAALAAETARLRERYGVTCFWNVAELADPLAEARSVVRQLRHHGGMRGFGDAARLQAILAELDAALADEASAPPPRAVPAV